MDLQRTSSKYDTGFDFTASEYTTEITGNNMLSATQLTATLVFFFYSF